MSQAKYVLDLLSVAYSAAFSRGVFEHVMNLFIHGLFNQLLDIYIVSRALFHKLLIEIPNLDIHDALAFDISDQFGKVFVNRVSFRFYQRMLSAGCF